MSAKTPLHVTPSRYALRAYLYRCLAASFAEEPQTLQWADMGTEYIARLADWENAHERLGPEEFLRREGEEIRAVRLRYLTELLADYIGMAKQTPFVRARIVALEKEIEELKNPSRAPRIIPLARQA